MMAALTGCSDSAATTAGGGASPATSAGTEAGAMADLQASTAWAEPRCRWLETGAHQLFYPQDTAVLQAAAALGYVELEQVGTGNRTGVPEPAWKVALTDVGKRESSTCGRGSSRSTVFGVPVSGRRFISGRRVAEPDMYNPDQTTFEVQFEWVPTPAGDHVKNVLTDKMTVEQGLATARVVMLYGNRVTNKGPNGWAVRAIQDGRATTARSGG